MTYIFLIAAFNAFFFSVLMMQKKKQLHDKILILWLVYLGLTIGIYGLFAKILFTDFPILSVSFISLLMLHGPFLYLYVSSLINEGNKFNKQDLFHFAPFIIFNLYLLISLLFPGESSRITLNHIESGHHTPFLFNIFLILTVLSGPVYIFFTIRLFRKLDINIFNNFSSIENVKLNWLRNLVYSFGIIWTALMITTTIHHVFHLFSWSFCTDGMFLCLSVFIILIGFFGLKQQQIFVHDDDQKIEYITENKTKYAGVSIKETDADRYEQELKEYMANEKPYLDSSLTLSDLSTKLNLPAYQLSRVINEKLRLNFFDFVNQYRVEEVKSKIADPSNDNLSLLGIAFDSGFNTKSAFNRVFKKMTEQTPSEYKKQLKR